MWLGASVSSQILQDLYAIENLDELDVRMVRPSFPSPPLPLLTSLTLQATLPILPTRLSTQLRNILSLFETQHGGRRLPVLIARQNIDGTEIEFSNLLIEDANNEQFSYIDFLCAVHQQIQARLLGDTKKADSFVETAFTTW